MAKRIRIKERLRAAREKRRAKLRELGENLQQQMADKDNRDEKVDIPLTGQMSMSNLVKEYMERRGTSVKFKDTVLVSDDKKHKDITTVSDDKINNTTLTVSDEKKQSSEVITPIDEQSHYKSTESVGNSHKITVIADIEHRKEIDKSENENEKHNECVAVSQNSHKTSTESEVQKACVSNSVVSQIQSSHESAVQNGHHSRVESNCNKDEHIVPSTRTEAPGQGTGSDIQVTQSVHTTKDGHANLDNESTIVSNEENRSKEHSFDSHKKHKKKKVYKPYMLSDSGICTLCI